MSLSNPELDMKWWNANLANDKKYADWAKKNIKLAQAIGHVTAADMTRLKNPGAYKDAADHAVDAVLAAQKANKDKDLKAMLVKFLELAYGEVEMAKVCHDQVAFNKQDQKTQEKMTANIAHSKL